MTRRAYQTASPAAVAGRPAVQRCQSPRALGLRVVPLWATLYPTDDPDRVARLAARLREACAWDGRAGLAWELREAVYELAHRRGETPEERRALVAWSRHTCADALPAWLATAAAEGWPHPDRR